MDRRKLNRITVEFLMIVVLVIALMLTGSLRHSARITLPEELESPGQSAGEPIGAGGALTVVAIDPDTVQAAVETLARPEQYRRTVSVQQLWNGGSGTIETTVTVGGGWTRMDRILVDGRIRHTVTDGETTHIWYGSEAIVYTAPAGEITADVEQSIPTYETVLALPVEDIAAADYRTLSDQVRCIYVETAEDPEGYTLRYWVSVDTGLLVSAERLLEGETVYRMWETACDLAPAITDEFTLPDGRVLTAE